MYWQKQQNNVCMIWFPVCQCDGFTEEEKSSQRSKVWRNFQTKSENLKKNPVDIFRHRASLALCLPQTHTHTPQFHLLLCLQIIQILLVFVLHFLFCVHQLFFLWGGWGGSSSSSVYKVWLQDVSVASALDVIQMLKFPLLSPMWLQHHALQAVQTSLNHNPGVQWWASLFSSNRGNSLNGCLSCICSWCEVLTSPVPGEQVPFNYKVSKPLFRRNVFNAEYVWADCSYERELLNHYWVNTMPLWKVQSGLNAACSYWWQACGWEWEKWVFVQTKKGRKDEKKNNLYLLLHWYKLWFGVSITLGGDSTSVRHKQTRPFCADFCLLWWVSSVLKYPWKVPQNAECGLCCCRTTKSSNATGDTVDKCHASHHQD